MREKTAKPEKIRKSVVEGGSGRKRAARKGQPAREVSRDSQAPLPSEEHEGSRERPAVALSSAVSAMGGVRQAGAVPPALPIPVASFTI
jgi:hypothetical protein